ncbi:hypothetical protein X740_06775 [Mesorhizobium sp. LNHC221B00]|nr:hypothetical protein X740_06775 [Mesorhizobium sp. LNHC221B00]
MLIYLKAIRMKYENSNREEAVMAMTHSRSRPVTASTWRATV